MRCVQRRACPRPLHLNLFPTSTPPLINYESAKITPVNLVTDALTPEVLNTLGRELCLRGDVLYEIQVSGDGVQLVPACS